VAEPPDLPSWSPWAALAALALVGLLAAVVGWRLGRRTADPLGFWGHVQELRLRLARMVLTLAIAVAAVFLVRIEAQAPYVGIDPYDNLAAQAFRRMAADLVPADVRLVVTSPAEGFVAMFNVALGLGVLASLPYLLAQVGQFLWPAMAARERRILGLALGPAAALFAVGAAFAYAVILPSAMAALYAFSDALGADGLLQVREFVSFTVLMMLLTGAAFLTPVAMYAVARAGLATARGLLRRWRHALVAIVVVAAFVTPDPTPVSQVLVAGPLFGLYLLGVAAAVPAQRAHERSIAG
jgi:sec-independent protein translocase protein TatC